jgi:hypothetical protein
VGQWTVTGPWVRGLKDCRYPRLCLSLTDKPGFLMVVLSIKKQYSI